MGASSRRPTTPAVQQVVQGAYSGAYYLFDLNLKPNVTGPGRPGRANQDSLSARAAWAIGWDFAALLDNMLRQVWSLA